MRTFVRCDRGPVLAVSLILVVSIVLLLRTHEVKSRLPSLPNVGSHWAPLLPSSWSAPSHAGEESSEHDEEDSRDKKTDAHKEVTLDDHDKVPFISYDLSIPPSHGCEDLVNDLQQRLIHAYTKRFEGIRYANIWGYLETENKGDAAIWSAQQILLSMLGIETMESCRFMDECDMTKFTKSLEDHRPHSAIVMAGGGNFNDYYWEDQPSRMKMISSFTNVSVRAFPQSIHMTKEDRIQETLEAFSKHHDLQLAARDRPSYEWLKDTFGDIKGIETDLVPDIAFMWGNRSDFRTETKKTHDILILARKDKEISAGDSKGIEWGEGKLDLGGDIGNVTYNKVDWRFADTPGIKGEEGKSQRAWAKAVDGFQLLGSARFVITDRLHGHILATLIGVPHVLMDSKLGKNLNFHYTWTKECECTRITTDIHKALDVAKLFFENEPAQALASETEAENDKPKEEEKKKKETEKEAKEKEVEKEKEKVEGDEKDEKEKEKKKVEGDEKEEKEKEKESEKEGEKKKTEKELERNRKIQTVREILVAAGIDVFSMGCPTIRQAERRIQSLCFDSGISRSTLPGLHSDARPDVSTLDEYAAGLHPALSIETPRAASLILESPDRWPGGGALDLQVQWKGRSSLVISDRA